MTTRNIPRAKAPTITAACSSQVPLQGNGTAPPSRHWSPVACGLWTAAARQSLPRSRFLSWRRRFCFDPCFPPSPFKLASGYSLLSLSLSSTSCTIQNQPLCSCFKLCLFRDDQLPFSPRGPLTAPPSIHPPRLLPPTTPLSSIRDVCGIQAVLSLAELLSAH